jgi:lysyl-tRNA synthetase class 2
MFNVRLRAEVYTRIRRFFADRLVLEVETPVLGRYGSSHPEISHLRSHISPRGTQPEGGGFDLMLQSSPEHAMKRLLAAGSGSIFQICKAFRAGESDLTHNPEFTMLEWYRLGDTHRTLMNEVGDLLRELIPNLSIKHVPYGELFEHYVGINPHWCDMVKLKHWMRANLPHLDVALAMRDKATALDMIFSAAVQPELNALATCVMPFDYPEEMACNSIIGAGTPRMAERFEVFLGGIEVANGYHEETSAAEQRERFDSENLRRITLGMDPVPIDELMLAALASGLPPCAGVALGIDRLLMFLSNADSIDEVLTFPLARI